MPCTRRHFGSRCAGQAILQPAQVRWMYSGQSHLDLAREPRSGFLEALISPIDLEHVFESIPCLSVGLADAMGAFALQVSSPAVHILLLVVAFFSVSPVRPRIIKLDGLLICGKVLDDVYGSVTTAVLSPVHCYKHPNHRRSTKGRPETSCGERSSYCADVSISANPHKVSCRWFWHHDNC